MDAAHDMPFLRQMMLDCCGLFAWTLSPALDVLDTNCPEADAIGVVLRSKGRKRALEKQMEKSRMPLFLGGTLGICWLIVFEPGEGGSVAALHAFGPVMHMDVTDAAIWETLADVTVPQDMKRALARGIRKIPVIPSSRMFEYAIFLYYGVTGQVIRVGDIVERNHKGVSAAVGEEGGVVAHVPAIVQNELYDMVRTGNLNYHDTLARAALSSPGIRMRSSAPLRQAQYSVVGFTTCCTWAAVQGGLPSDTAYGMCDAYVTAVDGCRTLPELAAVSHTMYEDFVRRVNRCQSDGVSRGIRAVREYIDAHVEEKLTAGRLAQVAGYKEYYLTRKFHSEMGVTLGEYVNRAKVERAKLLLSTERMGVEEVSRRLSFSSRSYFSEVFRKIEGVSPGEYRERAQDKG